MVDKGKGRKSGVFYLCASTYPSRSARSAPPRLRKLPHQASRRLMPSATSRDLLCEMVDHLTAKVVTDATFHLLSGEQTSWFNNGPFTMHPMRLNAVEPGTFGRQPARNDAHSCMALTLGCQHAAIVLLEPTAHFLTHMPGGVIPDEDQYALALALHLLAEPL